VINRAALSSVLGNPNGYPWPAKSLHEVLFGAAEEAEVEAEGVPPPKSVLLPHSPETTPEPVTAATALKGKRYIGLYFR
jgi:hypothetical protein